MSRFFIKSGYKERLDAEQTPNDPKSEHQPDVYALAGLFVQAVGAHTVIDVGCGSGSKFHVFPGRQIVGLDRQVNLDVARVARPEMRGIEIDLNAATADLFYPREVAGSVLICADVVEHLNDPTPILETMAAWLEWGALAAFISTPERDCFYTTEHVGPPPNASHVREWNLVEFGDYLRSCGLSYVFLGLTRSHTSDPRPVNILAVARGQRV